MSSNDDTPPSLFIPPQYAPNVEHPDGVGSRRVHGAEVEPEVLVVRTVEKRPEARAFELVSDIRGRLFDTGRPDQPPFERITREVAHVPHQCICETCCCVVFGRAAGEARARPNRKCQSQLPSHVLTSP